MICGKCHQERSLDEFSLRDKERGVLHKFCKSCHSLYRRQHYERNRVKYIEKASKWNKKQWELLKQFLFEKLLKSACVDCGEDDILVLDFDHLRDKEFSITQMYRDRRSLEAIEKELAKCVVRCANCHRRKTAREIGSWKYKLINKEK